MGTGSTDCDDCGEDIPRERQVALSGVRTCVACQTHRDRTVINSAINRRGNKDSHLR
ncbi:TraR/DksA C4-type zinc finger protein [Sphingomonas sp. RB1R13]|uniref:TraR/DksA C4-type zinc finger protein n=1 Tax=Sphingomonas sp. RB1R13 TaxID=3096159 RepID=UPI002FC5D258